ncbi:hypothetical protein BD289DRAFT_374688 [Coniella lustricola]|uniref:UBC core domain-containing protein n=1 Tax=Coniella lustricola TaxID=2025994 RepID=A0A2T2ZZC1_9PEZI|nr:hypothetical protein BD289DRAFT_374688 [Coniella lustricola]
MSSEQFDADVRSVRSRLETGPIPGVARFDHGKSDGEATFELSHSSLAAALPIRLVSSDIKAYPDDHHFILQTDAENPPPGIVEALGDLQNFTFGQNLYNSLRDVSRGLQRALDLAAAQEDQDHDSWADCEDPFPLDNASDDDDDDFDNYDAFSDQVDDDAMHDTTKLQKSLNLVSDSPGARSQVRQKMKRDLRKARSVGIKVSILSGRGTKNSSHLISLSVRASKLGLSLEALEAWDIEPSEYIVLLFQIGEPYVAADQVVLDSTLSFNVGFRLGKCSHYKPNVRSAHRALGLECPPHVANDDDSGSREFNKLFISASLDQFMNAEFLALFRIRMAHGYDTWADTTTHLKILKFKPAHFAAAAKAKSTSKSVKAEAQPPPPPPIKDIASSAAILRFNSFSEPHSNVSTPLVAMQFAMHYLARCTEYCLCCHQRLAQGFEALKPFVCQEPLCLFQYITMGFGPSIEDEIKSRPYVVDLLISLCYSSVRMSVNHLAGPHSIREFPTGLCMKVPRSDSPERQSSKDYISVSVDLLKKQLFVNPKQDIGSITGNTWVVLSRRSPYNHAWLRHQAYLGYVDNDKRTAEIQTLHLDPSITANDRTRVEGRVKMRLYVYNAQFDDLDSTGMAQAMVNVLETLPPICNLREYLLRNPLQTLKHYPGLTPAVLTLLQWIVASNRSCILQVTGVQDSHATDQSMLQSIKVRTQEALCPLTAEYVQFRFLQGTPDKEIRFQRALSRFIDQTQFPTLFAWHGSSLSNWHSILRQGLDFRNVANGRTYGNGVYLSPFHETSQGYAKSNSIYWPNSALNATNVMALCEIINRPQNFVSTQPHYVLKDIDWVQCRYLVVKTHGATGMSADISADSEMSKEVLQDPLRKVYGPGRIDLRIPSKVFPSNRFEGLKGHQEPRPSSKRTHTSFQADLDTDEEDEADLEVLYSDDEDGQLPPHKKITSDMSPDPDLEDSNAELQAEYQRPETPPNTDFRPGTLDLTSIPRLALPAWANANSSKRLALDIKRLQQIQAETAVHELGWYVDFETIENMFQWIVELHSFDPILPLAQDMREAGISSVVLEVRFGRDYPYTPPFIRVIRPQFLPFMHGGGGHVTLGGAVCMELLTSDGWLPTTTMEAVFLSIKMAMSSSDPRPARLNARSGICRDYSPLEAIQAFERAAARHGWTVPADSRENALQVASDRL